MCSQLYAMHYVKCLGYKATRYQVCLLEPGTHEKRQKQHTVKKLTKVALGRWEMVQ